MEHATSEIYSLWDCLQERIILSHSIPVEGWLLVVHPSSALIFVFVYLSNLLEQFSVLTWDFLGLRFYFCIIQLVDNPLDECSPAAPATKADTEPTIVAPVKQRSRKKSTGMLWLCIVLYIIVRIKLLHHVVSISIYWCYRIVRCWFNLHVTLYHFYYPIIWGWKLCCHGNCCQSISV